MNNMNYKTDNFVALDLARWASGLRYEDLSAKAVDDAKRFWFDSVGCALGGVQTEDARILLEHYTAMSPGGGPCSVFGTDATFNPVDAAFLNSHLVRALDFNDIYWKADPVHPSDLICGPLAVCQAEGLGGRALILATVIAYEVECRLAEFGLPGIREYGWHHATLSGFASAIACGRMLDLPPNQTAHAVGISASRTGTLGAVTAGHLTMMKNTVDPWASRVGVESSLLAQRGFTGPSHIIDGKEGLCHTMAAAQVDGKPCQFDLDLLTADLPTTPNDTYRVSACSMKSFPVEALMHSPLSALMDILRESSPDQSDIERIEIEVIARAADILGDPTKYRPTSRETADHSLPYAVAIAIADGKVTPGQFDETRIADPSLAPLMDAVRVVPNGSFEARFPEEQPSRVTLKLRNGSTLSREVSQPKGDPRNPMTSEEILVKFNGLASATLTGEEIERLISRLRSIDELDDIGEIIV